MTGGEQNDRLQQPFIEQNGSPNERGSAVQTIQSTNNKQKQPTENLVNQNTTGSSPMDVHHPHHPSHKKKWSEYLLEFFMLFLAVFLGFLAESKREQIDERHTEKEYMRSTLEDLKQDSSRFSNIINFNDADLKRIDTAINLLNSSRITDSISKILYYSHLVNPYFATLVFNQRTIAQLKAAGGFRLITKQDVSDKIIQYNDDIELAAWLRQEVLSALKDDRSTGYVIFNDFLIKEFKPEKGAEIVLLSKTLPLLTDDKKILIPYANKLKMRYDWLSSYNESLKHIQKGCIELIELANKEYHLEDE